LISSESEYQKAREELAHLTRWLARLESSDAPRRKGLTAASVSSMIRRIQRELDDYEAAPSEDAPAPDDPGAERPPEDAG
jgi:hypothetical protein